jgi:hypothetical protein
LAAPSETACAADPAVLRAEVVADFVAVRVAAARLRAVVAVRLADVRVEAVALRVAFLADFFAVVLVPLAAVAV